MKRILATLARSAASVAGRRPLAPAPSRCATVLVMVLVALALTTAPALSATEGPATMSEARAARAALLLQEREARQAQRRSEAEQTRKQRVVEREERAARLREQRQARSGTRVTPHGSVEIECGEVRWHFVGFAPGTHTITEIVYVDGEKQPVFTYTFSGEEGSNTTPLAVSAEAHRIDARAKWIQADGAREGWDIASRKVCGGIASGASYELEKRQKIIGSGGGYVTTPLNGEVGQTIEYEILVHNTGSVFLDFSNFSDPHCDAGTIKGGLEGPLAPNGTAKFTCTHVITPADQTAGSYSNTATVTGTPYGGDTPIDKSTNTVVVTVPQGPEGGGSNGGGSNGGGSNGGGSNGGGSNGGGSDGGSDGSTSGSIGVLGTIGTQSPKGGALAVSASAPALNGRPQGCVRSSFVVTIKAKGVKQVSFYLDGHKLRTLTARNARAGVIAVHIPISKLRVGVHHVTARITMSPLTASTKAVVASRSMAFARCASSRVTPRFTG